MYKINVAILCFSLYICQIESLNCGVHEPLQNCESACVTKCQRYKILDDSDENIFCFNGDLDVGYTTEDNTGCGCTYNDGIIFCRPKQTGETCEKRCSRVKAKSLDDHFAGYYVDNPEISVIDSEAECRGNICTCLPPVYLYTLTSGALENAGDEYEEDEEDEEDED